MSRQHRALPAFALALPLLAGGVSGCAGPGSAGTIAPEAAGLGAGAGAGILTGNPLIGVAVAIATRLVAADAVSYVQNEHQRQMHIAIASAAALAEGEQSARWSTSPNTVYEALFGTASGHVQVVRQFGGRIPCREILYSVDEENGSVEDDVKAPFTGLIDGSAPHDTAPAETPADTEGRVFAAMICRGGSGWQWAVSAPSTHAP